jgi:hypothetical protein
LQALNVPLKVDDTAIPPERRAALERPYAAYKFPKYSKDEQVEKLLDRIKSRNIKKTLSSPAKLVPLHSMKMSKRLIS